MDDFIITGDNVQGIKALKGQFQDVFEVKNLRQLRYFLEMKVTRSKEVYFPEKVYVGSTEGGR